MLGTMQVVSDDRTVADSTRITLEEDGQDDGTPVHIRRTQVVTPCTLTLTKEVRSPGERQYRLRHSYRLRR